MYVVRSLINLPVEICNHLLVVVLPLLNVTVNEYNYKSSRFNTLQRQLRLITLVK